MSKWTLSLTDLANQAEAFLEQVDKKAAESLQEEDGNEDEEDNIFSTLNNSVSLLPETTDTRSDESHSSPEMLPATQDLVSMSDDSEGSKSGELDRLELENKLIKQEVTQLTDEIGFLSSKLSSYRDKLLSHHNVEQEQQSKLKERDAEVAKQVSMMRHVKETEADLREALTAKDTQIGVLKVRLAEADSELVAQTVQIKTLEEELKVSSSCYRELSELRNDVAESNELVAHYKQIQTEIQEESRKREDGLQCQITHVTNTLHGTQQLLSSEKRKYNSTVSDLKLVKNELEFARKDLSDYKERATRVLQAKEKRAPADSSILDNEGVEVLIQERNLLETELRSTKSELEIMREHLNSVEQVHSEELQEALDHCSASESALKERERELTQYQDIVCGLQQEVQVAHRDITALRASCSVQVRALRAELQTEQTQRSDCGAGGVSNPELEVKIKSLTEVLLNKQSEVERLSGERSSLVLRLESLETVLQTVERKNNAVSVPLEREGFVGQRTAHNNKRLRDALNSIDKLSVRLGVFLRRYPPARLMVLGYMVLLHTWVMVVLLTYTPEIHDNH